MSCYRALAAADPPPPLIIRPAVTARKRPSFSQRAPNSSGSSLPSESPEETCPTRHGPSMQAFDAVELRSLSCTVLAGLLGAHVRAECECASYEGVLYSADPTSRNLLLLEARSGRARVIARLTRGCRVRCAMSWAVCAEVYGSCP